MGRGEALIVPTAIFLSGQSANDALGAAGRAHRALLESEGYDFVEVNFADAGSRDLLNRTIQQGGVEFAFSAMGIGATLGAQTQDGKEVNLWEALRIPFLSLNGDSPAYYFDRHVPPTRWHACLYYYPEHLELRRRLPLASGLFGLVPPVPFDRVDRRGVDLRAKERGKLLFLKNGNDPEKLVQTWREAAPGPTFMALAELSGELARAITDERDLDIDASVTRYFAARGWQIEGLPHLRLFFVAQLDDYLRRIKSAMIADAIADFPVEIHGVNWEHMSFAGRRATYVPGGDYAKTRELMLGALGIVDMSPNTQCAPHDRSLRAMGLYTLSLTNEQRFFSERYESASEFSYRFDKEAIRAKVADVLAHPARYVELGVAVAEAFLRDHRPEDITRFMIDTASHLRLAGGPRHAGLQDYFGWPPARLD